MNLCWMCEKRISKNLGLELETCLDEENIGLEEENIGLQKEVE